MLVGDSHADGDARCRDRHTDAGAHALAPHGDPTASCDSDTKAHRDGGRVCDTHICGAAYSDADPTADAGTTERRRIT